MGITLRQLKIAYRMVKMANYTEQELSEMAHQLDGLKITQPILYSQFILAMMVFTGLNEKQILEKIEELKIEKAAD